MNRVFDGCQFDSIKVWIDEGVFGNLHSNLGFAVVDAFRRNRRQRCRREVGGCVGGAAVVRSGGQIVRRRRRAVGTSFFSHFLFFKVLGRVSRDDNDRVYCTLNRVI